MSNKVADLAVYRWAMRNSNPRPSPCKGEENMQVRELTSESAVPSGPSPYLRVPSSCYAVVMRWGDDIRHQWVLALTTCYVPSLLDSHAHALA
jgi:hypothetical protein